MRVIAVLLFLTVCAYIGANLYEDLTYDVQTVQAESETIIESTQLYGIAVRREQQLCSPDAMSLPENGKRYPAGGTLCLLEDGSSLSAPASAVFFEHDDGLEYLSPDRLFPFSSEAFSELMVCEPEKQRHSLGRLVLDNVWYFAAEVKVGSAPEIGQRCRLLFQDIEDESQALVWAVCENEGREYVLLRLNGGSEGLLSLRQCSAELILKEYRGLKIPKEAVRQDGDGNKYICVLTAGLVETRSVDIIYTGYDFCLAQQAYSWDALREGESVVINREILDEGLVPG